MARARPSESSGFTCFGLASQSVLSCASTTRARGGRSDKGLMVLELLQEPLRNQPDAAVSKALADNANGRIGHDIDMTPNGVYASGSRSAARFSLYTEQRLKSCES